MKFRLCAMLAVLAVGGFFPVFAAADKPIASRAEQIRAEMENPASLEVLVAAHRASVKTAPENSCQAVRAVIALGVDIIEIDVRKTKDGELVIMHDATVDRTTTGKGKVTELTLPQIKELRLKGPDGKPTTEQVPTLVEILEIAAGKVLLNLDKADPYLEEIIPLLARTGTSRQVILKGTMTLQKRQAFREKHPGIVYMPIFRISKDGPVPREEQNDVVNFSEMFPLDRQTPMAELSCDRLDNPAVSAKVLARFRQAQVRTWINTLAVSHPADYTDKAALKNPDLVWGKLLESGFSAIQTDESQALLDYLRKKGRHK